MRRHKRQVPPEVGINARPPGDSVVYASLVGDVIVGWVRARIERGTLTMEAV